jgi:hypothetical protein
MRVNRRFLNTGVFLLAIGGVLVAADLGALDTTALADALRLWPLAIVAVGASLVLRRTQLNLPAGMLAAAVPGLVLGGAFAVVPRFAGDCGAPAQAATATAQQGTFDGLASVSVTTGCGSLILTTGTGNEWRLDAANTAGRMPIVQSTARSLSIDSSVHAGWDVFNAGRDTWNLTVPTSAMDRLGLTANLGRTHLDLPGAQIERLVLTANASEVVVDASAASISNLSASVNLGLLSLHPPNHVDLAGSLRIRGGELEVCTPPGVGVRLSATGVPREVTVGGQNEAASTWESPDYASAPHHTDLSVSVNFGVVKINPIGGCK